MDKILVVEDEPDIREILEYNLAREGFRVIACGDGAQGVDAARREAPALILLDLMLPGIDGVEACRLLKQDPITSDIPVIMVTAKSEESDVVLGLGVGADDYIAKPFSPKELVARVRAVLRRGPARQESLKGERLVFPGLTVDLGRHQVVVDGEEPEFTATELRLLHFLASHPGRVFSRAHLVSRVIGENAVVIERNIDVHIRAIRKKLGEQAGRVSTVRRVGYRFLEELPAAS